MVTFFVSLSVIVVFQSLDGQNVSFQEISEFFLLGFVDMMSLVGDEWLEVFLFGWGEN